MTDDITQYNQQQWDELARRGVLYSRPLLDLTPQTAREWLDPFDRLGDVRGKRVLCLASGGGKQSAAFGVLGAQVSVQDLSPEMLRRDQLAAAHYGYPVDARQGDMRRLTACVDAQFDVVWQPYSLNYIPDPQLVFNEVARVLKPAGLYYLQIHNPFVMGMHAVDWNGAGYLLKQPYAEAEVPETPWTFEDEQGRPVTIASPRMFRHTLSSVLNGLAERGFCLTAMYEHLEQDSESAPGSWEHFTQIAPPWLSFFFSLSFPHLNP